MQFYYSTEKKETGPSSRLTRNPPPENFVFSLEIKNSNLFSTEFKSKVLAYKSFPEIRLFAYSSYFQTKTEF